MIAEGLTLQEKANLLFYNYSLSETKRRIPRHEHAHWQLEVALGEFEVETSHFRKPMHAGEIVLLPPFEQHVFHYPARKAEWLTVRFEYPRPYDDALPVLAKLTPTIRSYAGLLSSLLPRNSAALGRAGRMAAEHALAGLVALLYAGEEQHGETSGFIRTARSYIEHNANRQVTVPEVARALGYSVSHATATFKQLTGRSLKQEIDQIRADVGKRMLLYSDHNISEIAEQMEFSDVYAFSRFMKRIHDKSPRALRDENV